ncbi:hypothetical protein FRC12_010270 [Ceratobasidium sp. 428]|nr:hypothetical protein FRC12_010270 [Ceratobasidium sp. 428]
MLKLFSDYPPGSMTFRLKRFSYRVFDEQGSPKLLNFLSYQNKLEELVHIGTEASLYSSPLSEITSAEPGMLLPELKCLTGQVETVRRLVPGRPVSKIIFNEHVPPAIMESIVSAISRATVPLVYLSILGTPSRTRNGSGILTWISRLSPFHESLETLIFQITLPVERRRISRPSVTQRSTHDWLIRSLSTVTLLDQSDAFTDDLELFKSALSHFVAIQTLIIKSKPRIFYSQIRRPWAPELDQFSWWAEVCPSLRFVSFFGNELSET